jgi:hypothetical protein
MARINTDHRLAKSLELGHNHVYSFNGRLTRVVLREEPMSETFRSRVAAPTALQIVTMSGRLECFIDVTRNLAASSGPS